MTTTLAVLNGRGDSKLTWDPADPGQCAAARAMVAELKASGYTFYLVAGGPADEVAAGDGALVVRKLDADEVVAPAALEALRAAAYDGNTLSLPKLAPKDYRRVFAVIDACGGRWDKKLARHVFPGPAAAAVAGVLAGGPAPAVNPYAFFPTPPSLADRVVARALGGRPAADVRAALEPSAGDGALVRAFLRAGGRPGAVDFVEADAARARRVAALGVSGVAADFLGLAPYGYEHRFDLVLMNPPFAVEGNATAYIDHVRHAWDFVAPGGTLAAVTPAGWAFTSTRKIDRFREWVEAEGSHDDLPDDAFPGLSVKTVLVLAARPA